MLPCTGLTSIKTFLTHHSIDTASALSSFNRSVCTTASRILVPISCMGRNRMCSNGPLPHPPSHKIREQTDSCCVTSGDGNGYAQSRCTGHINTSSWNLRGIGHDRRARPSVQIWLLRIVNGVGCKFTPNAKVRSCVCRHSTPTVKILRVLDLQWFALQRRSKKRCWYRCGDLDRSSCG
jgi:hypothetical protein